MSDIVFSELLCFLHSKYGIVPSLTIQNAILSFYEVELICDAKKLLYEISEKSVKDYPPHKMRQGESKKKGSAKT